jgi:hypothetical protein
MRDRQSDAVLDRAAEGAPDVEPGAVLVASSFQGVRSSGSLLLLADGLGQLGLAHAGTALDPELPGPLVQLLLGVATASTPV